MNKYLSVICCLWTVLFSSIGNAAQLTIPSNGMDPVTITSIQVSRDQVWVLVTTSATAAPAIACQGTPVSASGSYGFALNRGNANQMLQLLTAAQLGGLNVTLVIDDGGTNPPTCINWFGTFYPVIVSVVIRN
jgi:hypothetical protein